MLGLEFWVVVLASMLGSTLGQAKGMVNLSFFPHM
jgi:hypothetical protein